jgi:hypothetical protein
MEEVIMQVTKQLIRANLRSLGFLIFWFLAPALNASTLTVVPGTSVIFDPDGTLSASQLAALGSNGPLGATPAVEALTFAAQAGQAITVSATGLVGCCSSADIGPDGYARPTDIFTPLGPISGFVASVQMNLVGVFTDGLPAGPAPASFDYSGGVGQTSFSPLLNQVFFIGDGLTGTGSGSVQTFNVPSGATELWLGFADALGFSGEPGFYGDNPGSLSVSAKLGPSTVPEPGAGVLLLVGLVALALTRRSLNPCRTAVS